MILLLDLGNTNLYCGVYRENKLLCEYRTHSDPNKSSDEYKKILKDFIHANDLNEADIKGAVLSSVVPTLGRTVKIAVEKLLNIECLMVGKNLKSGLAIHIDNPNELGSDLVSVSVGAKVRYGYPTIICDFGTATKILVVDKAGAFAGCIIAPGIKISMKALSNSAAQLMETSLIAPDSVIGKNSNDSINSGIIYGTIEMVEGLVKKIENELNYKFKKVITGGNSLLIKDHISSEYIYDSNLIMEGLYQIYLKNRKEDDKNE